MKSPKASKTSPTTTHLRAEDSRVLRAEIEHFRQKITEKAIREPHKAAVILSEWIHKSLPIEKKIA